MFHVEIVKNILMKNRYNDDLQLWRILLMDNFLLTKNEDISLLLQRLQAMMASADILTRGKVKHALRVHLSSRCYIYKYKYLLRTPRGNSSGERFVISFSLYAVMLIWS